MKKILDRIYEYQNSRFLWLLVAVGSLSLVLIAHFIFQVYLFMPPCEQCVYIRFAFLCIFFGGLICLINPKNMMLKIVTLVFCFYGSIKGFLYSDKLNQIHEAIRSGNPFGFEGCSMIPHYPFDLPLHKWYPDMFLQTGDCGFDNPIVPSGEKLDAIQQYFIALYADGWYLVPSYHFLNMAQICIFVFGLIGVFLLLIIVSNIIHNFRSS